MYRQAAIRADALVIDRLLRLPPPPARRGRLQAGPVVLEWDDRALSHVSATRTTRLHPEEIVLRLARAAVAVPRSTWDRLLRRPERTERWLVLTLRAEGVEPIVLRARLDEREPLEELPEGAADGEVVSFDEARALLLALSSIRREAPAPPPAAPGGDGDDLVPADDPGPLAAEDRARLERMLDAATRPSEESWQVVCDLLGEWSGPGLVGEAIPRLGARLAKWPAPDFGHEDYDEDDDSAPEPVREAPAAWLERVAAGDAVAPLVLAQDATLEFERCGPAGARNLARCPALQSLRQLHLLANDLGVEGAEVLARSRHLANLRTLRISGNELGDAGARALVTSPHLRGLVRLGLWRNEIGPEGAAAIAREAHLPRLAALDLGGNPLGADGVRRLCGEGSRLRGLKALDLREIDAGAGGIAALAEAAGLEALHDLGLAGNALGPETGARLAGGRWFAQLRTLMASENRLGDDGATALAGALGVLRVLDLAANGVGVVGLGSLAASAGTRVLRRLDLASNGIDDDGLRAFLAADLPRLWSLQLGNPDHLEAAAPNHFGVDGLAALAANPSLGALEELSLEGVPIGDAGAELLAAAPALHAVESLSLSRCDLGPRGAAALAKAELPALSWLELDDNQLGDEGLRALARAPWLARVGHLSIGANRIGAAGAAALASGRLGGLRSLSLAGNLLADEGAELLAQRLDAPSLLALDLSANGIEAAGARALAAAARLAGLRELSLSDNPVRRQGARALASSPHLRAAIRAEWEAYEE